MNVEKTSRLIWVRDGSGCPQSLDCRPSVIRLHYDECVGVLPCSLCPDDNMDFPIEKHRRKGFIEQSPPKANRITCFQFSEQTRRTALKPLHSMPHLPACPPQLHPTMQHRMYINKSIQLSLNQFFPQIYHIMHSSIPSTHQIDQSFCPYKVSPLQHNRGGRVL